MTSHRGETDLAVLLASMRPVLHDGDVVFCSVNRDPTADEIAKAIVIVRESEGTTLVLRSDDAIALRHIGHLPMSWITLTVHSALDAVGLTAAVAGELARDGIPCNVVAGFFHDHIFVPEPIASTAMRALARLSDPDR